MTENGFRKIALGMPGAVEASHMGHPDFRAGGRIFATLAGDGKCGMVKLTPELQKEFIAENPKMFQPVNGAWGAQGATRVFLRFAGEEALGRAMTEAFKGTSKRKK